MTETKWVLLLVGIEKYAMLVGVEKHGSGGLEAW